MTSSIVLSRTVFLRRGGLLAFSNVLASGSCSNLHALLRNGEVVEWASGKSEVLIVLLNVSLKCLCL